MSSASNAKKLLIRAVECDQVGRILEAQTLYTEGIAQLMQFVNGEPDEAKRKGFLSRIKEYMDRADAIKARINGKLMLGEVVSHVSIDENDTGFDYDQLFGKYMDDKTVEIMLEEPYMTQNYQYHNLVRFLELAATNCPNLKYFRLITKEYQDAKNPDQQLKQWLHNQDWARSALLQARQSDVFHWPGQLQIPKMPPNGCGYMAQLQRSIVKRQTILFSFKKCNFI
ncbi:MIT domain-containing protein 1 isoform X2 [Drosophila sechellia]|uniref:MIT domain-containing protein 1 isoform X2 n=1 Tax=Drosophila sechellia TaxID=7238 RepID=UPI0013DDB65C|nr:MIT domain-containing protein 1 isoform X2 [Drosophila sechellia]